MTKEPAKRIAQLDALRGVAALTVVFSHFINIFPEVPLLGVVKRTPLVLTFAGHQAVILFFLLSGFVLSLPYLEQRSAQYASYAIRRIFRIYVPYICSVFGALVLAGVITTAPLPLLSEWFNRAWSSPMTGGSILDHVLFLGSFNNAQLNPVYWSLVHEMRISLVFPFVALLLLRTSWWVGLGTALGLSFCAGVINKFIGGSSDYLYSFHYLAFFIVGNLLARHQNLLGSWYSMLGIVPRSLLGVTGMACYAYGRELPFIIVQDWVIAIGATVFICLALFSGMARQFLSLRIARILGDISYSLYLWHAVILLAGIHLLYGTIPTWSILALCLAITLWISAASYRWIERPAIKAGKRLSERLLHGKHVGMPLPPVVVPTEPTLSPFEKPVSST